MFTQSSKPPIMEVIEEKGVNYLKTPAGKIRVIDGNSYPEEVFVSIGESTSAPIVLCDPQSPELDPIYQALRAEIKTQQQEDAARVELHPVAKPSPETYVLQSLMNFVREFFFLSESEIRARYPQLAAEMDKTATSQLVPFPVFLARLQQQDNRRHSLLNAYLIRRLIKDKLLPEGNLYHAQDLFTPEKEKKTGEERTWVIYRPLESSDAYSIDTAKVGFPYRIIEDGGKKEVKTLYGQAWAQCGYHYVASWSPPDMSFYVKGEFNQEGVLVSEVFYFKANKDAKEETLTKVKYLGAGGYGSTSLVQGAVSGTNYVVKEFNVDSGLIQSRYITTYPDVINEARINQDYHQVGACYCVCIPFKTETEKLAKKLENMTPRTLSRMYTLMKYVPGKTLEEYATTVTTPENFLSLAISVLRLVQKVHKFKLFHGDINDGNLLVQEDTKGAITIDVIDFGYSRYQNSSDPSLYASRYNDIKRAGLMLQNIFKKIAIVNQKIHEKIQILLQQMTPVQNQIIVEVAIAQFNLLLQIQILINTPQDKLKNQLAIIATQMPPNLYDLFCEMVPTSLLTTLIKIDCSNNAKLMQLRCRMSEEVYSTLLTQESLDQWCSISYAFLQSEKKENQSVAALTPSSIVTTTSPTDKKADSINGLNELRNKIMQDTTGALLIKILELLNKKNRKNFVDELVGKHKPLFLQYCIKLPFDVLNQPSLTALLDCLGKKFQYIGKLNYSFLKLQSELKEKFPKPEQKEAHTPEQKQAMDQWWECEYQIKIINSTPDKEINEDFHNDFMEFLNKIESKNVMPAVQLQDEYDLIENLDDLFIMLSHAPIDQIGNLLAHVQDAQSIVTIFRKLAPILDDPKFIDTLIQEKRIRAKPADPLLEKLKEYLHAHKSLLEKDTIQANRYTM